jgi:hypothetical protein
MQSASCISCLITRLRTPSTYWVGGHAGSRAQLDVVTKRKECLCCACQEPNSSHPAHNLVTIQAELLQLLEDCGVWNSLIVWIKL